MSGKVVILDPTSLQMFSSFSAHVAGMCDMDIVGNYLVTCRLDNSEWGAWPQVGGVVMNEDVVCDENIMMN